MFVACQVLRCPIGEYTKESLPFLLAVSAVTILLIFTPECCWCRTGCSARKCVSRAREDAPGACRFEQPGP
jgi:hypothetical protein